MGRRLLAVLITLGIMSMVTGLAAKPPPKQVTIDKFKKKKSAVAFNHEAHSKKLKIKCVTCHHTKKQISCSTDKCHGAKAEGKKPGGGEMSMKKNPFHISCVDCHKKEKKGPAKCKECHK